MSTWKDVVLSEETTLAETISRIDASALQFALVLNGDGTLAGVVTDGDLRRASLRGQRLESPVAETMNSDPVTVPAATTRDEMLALMRRKAIHHLPLIDTAGRVMGMVTLDELIGAAERPNWVVLMAGGLGTRLHPLTRDLPKPLLAVGGKPILETIVESFAGQGFRRLFLSVNFKAEMIRNHFGDGERWGVQIEYLHEEERLGTAGALALLPGRPAEPVVVMNGDLLTRVSFADLLQFHDAQQAIATMAVREHEFRVPYGVVRLDGARIESIEEKPVQTSFVNAGIYALSPEALDYLPGRASIDMPMLFERLIAAGKTTTAYPLRDYWLDIGRLEEFEQAQKDWGGEVGQGE